MSINTTLANFTALFGGTFDPIHNGHLQSAISLAQEIGLQQVILLPNHVPPHRPAPQASTEDRLAMLRLAIADKPLFTLDDQELQRTTPSYALTTLQTIRYQQGSKFPLAFIVGLDSLITIDRWYQWQSLLNYCHLIVCARPGYPINHATPPVQDWLQRHRTSAPDFLHQQPQGLIYLADTPLIAISSTEIRQRLQQQKPCDHLLPAAVCDYIQQQGLYHQS